MSKFIQTHFFYPSTFSLTTKQKREKINFFLSFHFSNLSPFFIISLFHPSNQTNPQYWWCRKTLLLFLAPPNTNLWLHWWSQSQIIWLHSYSAQPKVAVHSSSQVKKKKKKVLLNCVFILLYIKYIILFICSHYFLVNILFYCS